MYFHELTAIEARIIHEARFKGHDKLVQLYETYACQFIRGSVIAFSLEEEIKSPSDWGLMMSRVAADLVPFLQDRDIRVRQWDGVNWRKLHSRCNWIGNFAGHQIAWQQTQDLPAMTTRLKDAVADYNAAVLELRLAAREQSQLYVKAREIHLAKEAKLPAKPKPIKKGINPWFLGKAIYLTQVHEYGDKEIRTSRVMSVTKQLKPDGSLDCYRIETKNSVYLCTMIKVADNKLTVEERIEFFEESIKNLKVKFKTVTVPVI